MSACVSLDAKSRVDRALEEPAQEGPGKFGGDGVGQDPAWDEAITDREFDQPQARPFEFDEAV